MMVLTSILITCFGAALALPSQKERRANAVCYELTWTVPQCCRTTIEPTVWDSCGDPAGSPSDLASFLAACKKADKSAVCCLPSAGSTKDCVVR
ncbi:hypothetical protein F5Y03DRAFT_365416 [Xylaria venustula]|nr:hypothetical protein F5Y03DRAFT_365416 [Xylaria venustula]